MKLVALPKSPFWGANIHVGYDAEGRKKFSPRSSKVRRDPSNVDEKGRRLDKIEARRILEKLQTIANEAMQTESATIDRIRFEEMVEGLLRACGKTVSNVSPPFEEFALETVERKSKDRSAATKRSYTSHLSAFCKFLDAHDKLSRQAPLSDFTLPHIQEYYDGRIAEGTSPATAGNSLKTLSAIFQRGIASEFVFKNPVAEVEKRDVVHHSKKPFSLVDLASITRALAENGKAIEFSDEWNLAIRFAIFTGARQSDCVSRKWSDFRDDFSTVVFVPQKKARIHRLGRDATVTLKLPAFLAREIAMHEKNSDSEWMCPNLKDITSGKTGLSPRFRAIMDFAGIEYEIRKSKGPKGADQCSHGYHSFRHTLKTELRAGGVSAKSNDYVTGHDDAKVGDRYIVERAETVYRECAPVLEAIGKAIG